MILVLNADYTPLNTVTLKKAYNLIYKGKAEVLSEDETKVIYSDVHSPTVIRLLRYVQAPYKKVVLTRQNIFRRDSYKCGYCGSKNLLTLDHILPKSKGGQNRWENLVTCCFSCNNKKDDRTPEQAGMKLLIKPYKPNYFVFLAKHVRDDWKPYLWNN